MISSFALLPFRPRAIRHFRSQLSFSAEFHDYDAILFLFGDISTWVTIKRAWWSGANEKKKKKGGWIIHPLASTSIAMKNWAATMHDGIEFRYRRNRCGIGYTHTHKYIYIRIDRWIFFPWNYLCRSPSWFARFTEQFLLTTDFFTYG